MSVRTTGTPMKNNSINRYDSPNAARFFFGEKSHCYPDLLERKNNNKVKSD